MKIIVHIRHFWWLGPNVWWGISQIWVEYMKPIRQMSDETWKFFGYTAVHGSVGPYDHLWPFFCLSVYPSICPKRFLSIFWRTQGGNGLKCCFLMYPNNLQHWLGCCHGLLIFPIMALFWLSEMGDIWGFRHFLNNAWKEWPEIIHVDVSWPPSYLIRLWSWSVDMPPFGMT